MSGGPKALKITTRINRKLKFLIRKLKIFTPKHLRMLWCKIPIHTDLTMRV